MISSFTGKYRFLSNFHLHYVEGEHRLMFPTNEHAYQAAKTDDLRSMLEIQRCITPGQAKKLGRSVKLRDNWDDIKLDIMLGLIRKKFADPALRAQLLATGGEQLVEGNIWNDTYWGVCADKGENHLGVLLMEVRAEIRSVHQPMSMKANH